VIKAKTPLTPSLTGFDGGAQIKHTIHDNVERAHVRVKASTDNVAGVKLPKFEYLHDGAESKMDMTGLGKGGQQIQNCKASYGQAIELLVELASLQVRAPRGACRIKNLSSPAPFRRRPPEDGMELHCDTRLPQPPVPPTNSAVPRTLDRFRRV
jgi:hypothetical protein